MEGESGNPVAVIRSEKRDYLKDLRSKQREFMLGRNRSRLNDVSECIQVSLSEFNELLLKLKQKPVPFELLRKIKNACVKHEYIEAIIRNDGAFQSLISILIGNDARKQLEAAACFANIACGHHKCSFKVAKTSGAYLVSFINGNSHFLQEQSSWAIANIANDCVDCFNIVIAQGVLPALLQALQSPLSSVKQCVVFALNACTQYEDPEVISRIQSNLVEHLLVLLEEDDFNISTSLNAAFTLSNCCFLSAKYSLNCVNVKHVERIVVLLQKSTENAENHILSVTPLLRCLGFLSYDDRIADFLLSHDGFIQSIESLIKRENCSHVLKEAFWVLSNVVAATTRLCLSPLQSIIECVRLSDFRLENSMILQVFYFLSVCASKSESTGVHIRLQKVFDDIENLVKKREELLEPALVLYKYC